VNTKWQLGSEQLVDSTVPVKVDGLGPADEIAAGPLATCARLGKEVHCWGDEKILGKEQRKPAKIDGLGEAAAIAVGPLNICAAGTNGAVSCTALEEGERFITFVIDGVTDAVTVAMGQSHACALAQSGEISCWGATDELTTGGFSRAQASPVRVKGVENAVALSAHATTSCAVTRDGGAWCWRWSRRKAGEQIGAERVAPGMPSARP
jgi:hypothetical protein